MDTPVTHVELRITCSEVNPINKHGRPKLLAKIMPDAILVWCKYCHKAHHISREQCEAAWAKGESVVSACEGQAL